MKNIRVVGSHPEKACVIALLKSCAEGFSFDSDKPIAIILDKDEVLPCGHFYGAACPMGMQSEMFERTVSYSMEDFKADIVALNVQEKPEYTCFELMAGDRMGRVFVGNKKGVGVNAVLIVSAVLLVCGLGLTEIIGLLNGILKTD